MIEEKFPKGAPGRKSFVYVPKQKKKFWRDEAINLRQVFYIMIPIHFLLLFVDFVVYNIEISILLADFFMIWLNFYNYMTLNKITCGIESILYVIIFLVSLTHMKRVVFDQEEWLTLFFYIV